MREVDYVMDKYGLVIDSRHLMLLADLMAFKVSYVRVIAPMVA